MAEETIISWTPANWITVVLMVGLGFALAGLAAQIVMQKQGKATS
jgi:hypothetical protein